MIDLTKQKFGRLTVQEFAGVCEKHLYWNCICDCGNTKRVGGGNLKNGHTQSCGCLRDERIAETNTTHGQSRKGFTSKEYTSWIGMRERCYNPKNLKYMYYGGRGIKVCDNWLESFENFLEDIGNCPTGMTLDRRDNAGDYCPENCRWATKEEQMNNKRSNVWVEHNGESRTIAQWERYLGMNKGILQTRLKRGWSIERALTTPIRR